MQIKTTLMYYLHSQRMATVEVYQVLVKMSSERFSHIAGDNMKYTTTLESSLAI